MSATLAPPVGRGRTRSIRFALARGARRRAQASSPRRRPHSRSTTTVLPANDDSHAGPRRASSAARTATSCSRSLGRLATGRRTRTGPERRAAAGTVAVVERRYQRHADAVGDMHVFWLELQRHPSRHQSGVRGSANRVLVQDRRHVAQRDFTIIDRPRASDRHERRCRRYASVGAPYSATLEAQLVTNLNPPTGSTPGPLDVVGRRRARFRRVSTLANGRHLGHADHRRDVQFQVQAALDDGRASTPDVLADGSTAARRSLRRSRSRRRPFRRCGRSESRSAPSSRPPAEAGRTRSRSRQDRLPTGLALAADGTVVGTPRAAGVYRATLRLSR